MSGPLARLEFVVRSPIGKNAKYKTKRGGGMYVTDEAKAFGLRVKDAAWVARSACPAWPRDPWVPSCVRLSYQLVDVRLDADSVRTTLKDSVEGVLYANDRVCEDGPAPLPVHDGNGARVAVVVELIGVRTPQEAEKRRLASERGKVARMLAKARGDAPKRRRTARKPRWVA